MNFVGIGREGAVCASACSWQPASAHADSSRRESSFAPHLWMPSQTLLSFDGKVRSALRLSLAAGLRLCRLPAARIIIRATSAVPPALLY